MTDHTENWEEILDSIRASEEAGEPDPAPQPDPAEEPASDPQPEQAAAPAETEPEPEKKESLLASAFEMLGNLVTAFLLVTVVLCFFFRLVDVDGTSMLDTLQDGDRLILRTALYTPARGDIVVLYQERDPEKPLIKRVIATAGDTLRLDVENDAVWLKAAGESEFVQLDEPYVHYPLAWGSNWSEGDILVPKGQVFVMGDHRNLSNDSRYLGCFPVEDVVGEAVFRLVPFGSFGVL